MNNTDRRSFLGGIAMATVAASFGTGTADAGDRPGLAFSNRAHIFASPKVNEKLIWCFRDVLGCGAPISLNAPGMAEPILAFRFPGGGAFCVEFTEAALDEQRARPRACPAISHTHPTA